MKLKLTKYVTISIFLFINQTPGEIPIFRTFLAKLLKIGYFQIGHDYDVTVTSYLGCWYLFWYVRKEKTYLGVSFSSSQRVV